MFADLHAILLLAALIVPLVAVAVSPAWRPRPLRVVAVALLPIAVVGLAFLSLLSARGTAVAEWLFPLVGMTVAGLFVKSRRAFEVMRWGLFGLAVVLSVHAMALRTHGYASSRASRMYQAFEKARLAGVAERLQAELPADAELPPGPVSDVLGDPAAACWERKALRPLWHTCFTGLHEVIRTPGAVWYPGGPIARSARRLEWRSENAPPDHE